MRVLESANQGWNIKPREIEKQRWFQELANVSRFAAEHCLGKRASELALMLHVPEVFLMQGLAGTNGQRWRNTALPATGSLPTPRAHSTLST